MTLLQRVPAATLPPAHHEGVAGLGHATQADDLRRLPGQHLLQRAAVRRPQRPHLEVSETAE